MGELKTNQLVQKSDVEKLLTLYRIDLQITQSC